MFFFQQWLYTICRKYPMFIKKRLLKAVRDVLPDANIEKRFLIPVYKPMGNKGCALFQMEIYLNRLKIMELK